METITPETAATQLSPTEIWLRVFNQVRREVDVATVWLAMQVVQPLTIDGSYFVVTIPEDSRYLQTNLLSYENATVIEQALQSVTGRVLAFRLIEGQTLEDWEREKQETAEKKPVSAVTLASPPPVQNAPPPAQSASPASPGASASSSTREVFTTWESLNEKLSRGYKQAPLIKYPHGQARYLIECVQAISDTIDALMPGPGQPSDEAQERQLAKTIERLGSVLSLDALFISLELLRYRLSQGKDIGLPR